MKTLSKFSSVVAVAMAMMIPGQYAQAGYTKIGVLDCNIEDGKGKIFGSKKSLFCTFNHANGTVERYTGSIGKIGIDLGSTKKASLKWGVFQVKDKELRQYPLAGRYYGGSLGASLGKGLGANALVGGSGRAIGLQPLSLETRDGLNINIGLSGIKLEPLR